MKIDIGQLKFIDSELRTMCLWLERRTGLEFTVTSLYRIRDKGVHGQLPLRGIDLRIRNTGVGEDISRLNFPHHIGTSVWCKHHPTGPTEKDFEDRYGPTSSLS